METKEPSKKIFVIYTTEGTHEIEADSFCESDNGIMFFKNTMGINTIVGFASYGTLIFIQESK